MSSLERLIDRLQGVKASDEWDLADIFLAQCGDFIAAMVWARRNKREESDNVTASESQTGFVIGDLRENILGYLDFPSFQEPYGLLESCNTSFQICGICLSLVITYSDRNGQSGLCHL
jgi:hypothetical protein